MHVVPSRLGFGLPSGPLSNRACGDPAHGSPTPFIVRHAQVVTELTELIPLSAWPEDTRLLMHRECPHPGAQLTHFDTAEGFRWIHSDS